MKIDEKEFEEFKLSLPKDIQEECFQWLNSAYDVPKALFIIHKKSLPQEDIDVKTYAKAFGMAGTNQVGKMSINILTGVQDVDALKENIKPMEYPIIFVKHEFGKGKNKDYSNIIIDGNKRLRKAFLEGIEKIKCYYISDPKLVKLIKMC